jgi:hypothetical protein
VPSEWDDAQARYERGKPTFLKTNREEVCQPEKITSNPLYDAKVVPRATAQLLLY